MKTAISLTNVYVMFNITGTAISSVEKISPLGDGSKYESFGGYLFHKANTRFLELQELRVLCEGFLDHAEKVNKFPAKLLEEELAEELGEGFININCDILKETMEIAGPDMIARMLSIENAISSLNTSEEMISKLEAKWAD